MHTVIFSIKWSIIRQRWAMLSELTGLSCVCVSLPLCQNKRTWSYHL